MSQAAQGGRSRRSRILPNRSDPRGGAGVLRDLCWFLKGQNDEGQAVLAHVGTARLRRMIGSHVHLATIGVKALKCQVDAFRGALLQVKELDAWTGIPAQQLFFMYIVCMIG